MPPLQTLPRQTLSRWHFLLLACLLVLPVFAAIRLSTIISPYIILGLSSSFSFIAYFVIAADKRKAQLNFWRIPESTLHLFELIGGWPGSFLAQRRFRHKISKTSYQFTFWLIVIAFQVVSLDYLSDWKYSAEAISLIKKYKG